MTDRRRRDAPLYLNTNRPSGERSMTALGLPDASRSFPRGAASSSRAASAITATDSAAAAHLPNWQERCASISS